MSFYTYALNGLFLRESSPPVPRTPSVSARGHPAVSAANVVEQQPVRGRNRPLSDLTLPQSLPYGRSAPCCLYDNKLKGPHSRAFSPIAGAGFEPATFGL